MPSRPDPAFLSAMREGKLVLFAGSGICRDAGLPLWPDFLDGIRLSLVSAGLLDPMYSGIVEGLVKRRDLMAAADLLSSQASRLEIAVAIRTILSPKGASAVIEALKCWKPRGVVTTNFDRLTEGLVGSHAWRLDNSESELALVPAAVSSGQPFVWKIHGDFDNSLDPGDEASARGGPFMVLTKGDFAALVQGDRGRQLSAGLFSVLQAHPVAFIGYSFTDPDITRALAWLGTNLKFNHRSWFISLAGEPPQSMPSNVTQFSPIKDWSELSDWALEVCRSSKGVPRSVEPPTATIPSAREIEAYRAVSRYLSDLESPDLTERVIASALFEDLQARGRFELEWLTSQIAQILGLGPTIALSLATATVRLLVEMGLAERAGPVVQMRADQASILAERAKEGWSSERRRFLASLVGRLPAESSEVNEDWLNKVESALIVVCSNLGEGMAEWASRGIGSDIGWPDLDLVVADLMSGDEEQRLATSVLRLLLAAPTDQEVPYLYRILAATYLANTVRLNPIAAAELRSSLARFELYVDANVLLPLLVVDHPNHQSTRAVIDESVRAGVRVCVLPQFINEVVSHRNGARREFEDLGGDFESLAHLADVLGPRTNVFVQGYVSRRPTGQIGTRAPWQQYLAQYSSQAILTAIHSARIEIVEPDKPSTEGPVYSEALGLIREEWRRKMGGPREEILNTHEAVQFAHIYERRSASGERRTHVWFLSNETVLQRVFARDPEKWRLPATFPYSAWVAFLDSRLIHGAEDPGAIVRAILRGQPQAFELPSAVALVRDKAFAGRVASQAEEEALGFAFSDFGVMKKLEAAQRALTRRGRQGQSAKDFAEARQEAVAEVSDALDAQISRLQSELGRALAKIRDLEKDQIPAPHHQSSVPRRRRSRRT